MKVWYQRHKYLLRAWFWIAAIVPTLIWWRESVLWVAIMSLYNNIETAFAAHEAHKSNGDDD